MKKTKRWLRRARKRLWGAKHYRAEVRKQIKQEHDLDKRRELKRREQKLTFQIKHRREVKENLAKKLKHLKHKKDSTPSGGGSGFATFDGKTVAAWMVPWLVKSRAAGWDGYVVSGVRTPAYSQSLCYSMCGAPTCPGRCAGIYSNHNMLPTQGYPYGAVDVTDYYDFEAIQFRIGSPLRNALPIDPVHFSVSGR
jgi:hypothetical protein